MRVSRFEQVHADVYDAQLAMLLSQDNPKLAEEDLELLGELEGILEVRGAATALRRRTAPIFEQAAKEALQGVFENPESVRPVSLWGQIAVRQQDLKMPTEAAKATVIVESRRMATEALSSATELFSSGSGLMSSFWK